MHQLKTGVQVVTASSGSATGGCASVNDGGCCGGTVGTEFVAALLPGRRDGTPDRPPDRVTRSQGAYERGPALRAQPV